MANLPTKLNRNSRGQAWCWYDGKKRWFGRFDTADSHRQFEAWVATLPENRETGRAVIGTAKDTTLAMLSAAFMAYAEEHYRQDGEPTGEADNVRLAMRPALKLYGKIPVNRFGPKLLKDVQKHMVADGLARNTINSRINRIRRVFKWGVSEQIVPPETLVMLQTVRGLLEGRTDAVETDPVLPVPEYQILAVKPHVMSPVWGMIQFGWRTGARPGETVGLRWCDIDAEQDVWLFRPSKHKTRHKQKKRVVSIGPNLQKLLHELGGNDTDYVFRPADAMAESGLNFATGECYSIQSYRTAIIRACELAFGCPTELRIDSTRRKYSLESQAEFAERRRQSCDWRSQNVWSPNQLRHNYGTDARRQLGIEAAQVGLGHGDIKTTQRYAEPNVKEAIEYARLYG